MSSRLLRAAVAAFGTLGIHSAFALLAFWPVSDGPANAAIFGAGVASGILMCGAVAAIDAAAKAWRNP